MSVHPGSIWIDENWEKLRTDSSYWVAANNLGIVAEGELYQNIVEGLDERGIKLSEVAIAHIPAGIVQ